MCIRDKYNTIWQETSFITDLDSEKFPFIDLFMPVTALTQFHLQEVRNIKQYRYWKIFNDNSDPVHLKDTFKSKTVSYTHLDVYKRQPYNFNSSKKSDSL